MSSPRLYHPFLVAEILIQFLILYKAELKLTENEQLIKIQLP